MIAKRTFFAKAYGLDASQNVSHSTTIPAPRVGSPALAPDTTPPSSPSSTQPPLSVPPAVLAQAVDIEDD